MPSLLGPPDILGTLSECSLGVQFHKLVPGATVRLQQVVGGAVIGDWAVSNADQAFDFKPGKGLKAGTNVQALQFLPGQGGLPSKSVHVDGHPTPAILSAGDFAKPLFECAECVWLFHVFPGAMLQVFSHGKELLGESIVRPDGQAHVDLKRALNVDDDLTAVQTACAAVGGPVKSASPIVGGHTTGLGGFPLPQTQVAPVKACATALVFEKVMAGAHVELTRTPVGGSPIRYAPSCLSFEPFIVWGYAPFQGKEELFVETVLEQCKRKVGTPVKLTVDPGPPDPPTIPDLICADAPDPAILLGGLEINARVEISITTAGVTVTLIFGVSAQQDSFPLSNLPPGTPKLDGSTTISVRQNLCGGPAGWSTINTTKVLASTPGVPSPVSPFNYSKGTVLTPMLTWADTGSTPCSKATAFDLRVATTPTMAPANIVFAPKLTLSGTGVGIPSGTLLLGTTYYWQVRAYRGAAPPSAWSTVFVFSTQEKVGNGPPGPHDLTFDFCQSCPGFSNKTITVTAPDQATAEAKAKAGMPDGCFLNPGKCP